MTKRRPEGIALAAGLAEPAGSLIGTQMGLDLNVVSRLIAAVTKAVIAIILRITGHA